MICKHCNTVVPDDSVICPSCGQKAEAASVSAPVSSSYFRPAGSLDGSDFGMDTPIVKREPTTPDSDSGLRFSPGFKAAGDISKKPETSYINSFERNTDFDEKEQEMVHRCPYCGGVLDSDAKFCNHCGKRIRRGIKMPAISKRGIIAAASIALVLVLLIVGFATNWFGTTGPATQIAKATQNTFTAGNFSVDFKYGASGTVSGKTNYISGTAYISIDPDERELMMYADMTESSSGDNATAAIYDGYYIVNYSGEYSCHDISKQLDVFFDAYEEGTDKDFSWEEFIDSIFGTGTYREAKKDIDFDELDSCLKTYVKKLNSKKWLKENAGYSVEKEDGITMHSFSPDAYVFLNASLEFFEKAFIDEDVYDEIDGELLPELRKYSDQINADIAFGIKGGKLVRLEGEWDIVCLEADFHDIGKTKINAQKLENMLAQAIKNEN